MNTIREGAMETIAEISVSGGTPKMRNIVKAGADWMLESELGPRLARAVAVKILLIHDLKKNEGVLGDCAVLIDSDIYCPREFEIRIDTNNTPYSRMLALSHEIIHVKQYAKNELYDYSQDKFARFHKRRIDYSKIPYRKQPWEKEAYARERPLLFSWADATNSRHLIKQRYESDE